MTAKTNTKRLTKGSTDAGSHGGRKWVVEVGRQDWNNERTVKKFSRFKTIVFFRILVFIFFILLNILKNIDQSGERWRGLKTLRVFFTRNYITSGVVQIQVIVGKS